MAGTIRPGRSPWLFSILFMDLANCFQICVYSSFMWEPSEPIFHCMSRTGWDTVSQCLSLLQPNTPITGRTGPSVACYLLTSLVLIFFYVVFFFCFFHYSLSWHEDHLEWSCWEPPSIQPRVNTYDMSPLYRVICSSVTEYWSRSHFCWCFNHCINLKGENFTLVHSWRDLELWSFGLVTLWWQVWGRGKLCALW